jgi:hypothetical protein
MKPSSKTIEGTHYKNLISMNNYELEKEKEYSLDDTLRRQNIIHNISNKK